MHDPVLTLEPHGQLTPQHITADNNTIIFANLHERTFAGNIMAGLTILVILITQTALKPAAHPAYRSGAQRERLRLCHANIDRSEMSEPGTAAYVTPTGTYPSDHPGFITYAHLLHLHPQAKLVMQTMGNVTHIQLLISGKANHQPLTPEGVMHRKYPDVQIPLFKTVHYRKASRLSHGSIFLGPDHILAFSYPKHNRQALFTCRRTLQLSNPENTTDLLCPFSLYNTVISAYELKFRINRA